ncbi:hypothetical protein AOQ84DRAFT_389317 [Glonium stellatum]|uniref:Rhodopsin domain-containing protein n=1 Tax=Glonium stellatum TaxID=574774 RepID=A0A8E2EZF7_9PEZI|nr:hypothetical protein AOQ84DRAFT_389317 [Glonium stellatum]
MSDSTSENLPVINRASTILGASLTFLIIAWFAIFLRLLVRFKTPGSLGWDDLFVMLAGLAATAGSVFVCLQPGTGMGHHIYTLNQDKLYDYFHYVYAANVTYCLSTVFIKISILIQYLRIFNQSYHYVARRTCIILLVVISCWGIAFFLISLLGCIPIAKNWDLSITSGHCVMFGSKDPTMLFGAFVSHAASNMFFDILVWILPIPFFKTLKLREKQKKGVVALITLGAV